MYEPCWSKVGSSKESNVKGNINIVICITFMGIHLDFISDGFGLWTVPESLKVVRALEILGIILLVFAFGAGVLKLCVKKDVLALFNVAGGLSILAGIH